MKEFIKEIGVPRTMVLALWAFVAVAVAVRYVAFDPSVCTVTPVEIVSSEMHQCKFG